jgi:predicted ATPase
LALLLCIFALGFWDFTVTIHLREISLPAVPLPDTFPFNVPVIRALKSLTFTSEITFFVGENGSGKSTLLEAIGAAANLPAIGSESTDRDETLKEMRLLAQRLKWVWNKRTRRGFFLRSEDFFGFAKRITHLRAELKADYDAIEHEYAGRSARAKGLAQMPFARELAALEQSYGAGLDAQSHGESYFKLFRARFVPGGLYLMDEPEAPLSPMRQLALMALLRDMTRHDAQFIIATHSPILLAYPGATILQFADGAITTAQYDDLEHVSLTRSFLNNPNAYLSHLFEEDG